jgi:hypothetical protein
MLAPVAGYNQSTVVLALRLSFETKGLFETGMVCTPCMCPREHMSSITDALHHMVEIGWPHAAVVPEFAANHMLYGKADLAQRSGCRVEKIHCWGVCLQMILQYDNVPR